MLSISQNSICLPARAFKTINKIREHTMATVPLLPPSVSLSAPPSLFSLPFCSRSFASTMQTFSGLSAPPLLRELQHKTSSCRQTAVAHTHTHTYTEVETNTQERKLTQKINIFTPEAGFLCLSLTHTRTHSPLPFSQPASLCAALTERNELKTNQRRLHKHHTVLEALVLKSLARTQRCTLFP